jgi:hypothetical protein
VLRNINYFLRYNLFKTINLKYNTKRQSDSSYFEKRDGYIYLRYKNFSVVDLEEAKQHAEIVIELCDGSCMPFILDGLNADAKFTQEARVFFTTHEPLLKVRKAQAYLVNTLANRMLFKFFIKFHKPKGPIKMFTNLRDAEAWVNQLNLKNK